MILREIPVSLLVPGEHNPREDFDEESLGELAATIREWGVRQALEVRPLWPAECPGPAKCSDARTLSSDWPDYSEEKYQECYYDGICYAGLGYDETTGEYADLRYEIISGQRRWLAAMRAELEAVPCIIKNCDDEEALIAAGIENIQREDLEPIEEGQWLCAVRDKKNYPIGQLAEMVGKSDRWVMKRMALVQSLPSDVGARVTRRGLDDEREGLTESQARPITKLRDNPNQQRQLAAKTEREKLNQYEVDSVATAVRDNPDKADEILATNLREEAEKSGHSVQTVVESIAKPIIMRKQERASVTEFGVITDVKSAALKLKQVLDRETFDDLIAAADDDALRMMRESLLYARESLGYALAAIDERLNITTGEIRMVK